MISIAVMRSDVGIAECRMGWSLLWGVGRVDQSKGAAAPRVWVVGG